MNEILRSLLAEHGKLQVPVTALQDDTDLFACGLDSLTIVNLMLAIESRFGVELPESLLTRQTFSSISGMAQALKLAAA